LATCRGRNRGRRNHLSRRQRGRGGLATSRGSHNHRRGGECRCPNIVKIHRRVKVHLLIFQIFFGGPILHKHMVDIVRWITMIMRGRTVWGERTWWRGREHSAAKATGGRCFEFEFEVTVA
jgi:hypothetical protein